MSVADFLQLERFRSSWQMQSTRYTSNISATLFRNLHHFSVIITLNPYIILKVKMDYLLILMCLFRKKYWWFWCILHYFHLIDLPSVWWTWWMNTELNTYLDLIQMVILKHSSIYSKTLYTRGKLEV